MNRDDHTIATVEVRPPLTPSCSAREHHRAPLARDRLRRPPLPPRPRRCRLDLSRSGLLVDEPVRIAPSEARLSLEAGRPGSLFALSDESPLCGTHVFELIGA